MSTWRERLDQRIDRCTCGEWRYRKHCYQCDSQAGGGESEATHQEVAEPPSPHNSKEKSA